jgi:hypothetical protein
MKNTLLLGLILASGVLACSSAPKRDRFSAQYVSCPAGQLHPAEVTNNGWYESWYVECQGQEYFCRYNKDNVGGWNGCHPSIND